MDLPKIKKKERKITHRKTGSSFADVLTNSAYFFACLEEFNRTAERIGIADTKAFSVEFHRCMSSLNAFMADATAKMQDHQRLNINDPNDEIISEITTDLSGMSPFQRFSYPKVTLRAKKSKKNKKPSQRV